MARISPLFIFCLTFMLSEETVFEKCRGTRCFSDQDWSRPCVGAHCQGRPEAVAPRRQFHTSGQVYPSFQQDAHFSHHQAQSAPLAPYTIVQPGGLTQQQAGTDGWRTNPKTITAEVFHPGCAGGTCSTSVSHGPTNDDSTTRECKGIGCKIPVRMRQKPKQCVGDGCGTHAGDDARGGSSPVHVSDRAAQFLDEFADFGTERGAWIQLACDMKSGQYQLLSDTCAPIINENINL